MVNFLADFVVRINDGLKKNVDAVYTPYSNTLLKVARLLLRTGCISSFSVDNAHGSSSLRMKIVLKYFENRPLLKRIELISRPGLRIYWTGDELSTHFSRNNFQGFYMISTAGGLCSSNELVVANLLGKSLGGEVLFKIHF